jgi:hypothetical protein
MRDAIDCDAHAPYWNWSAISHASLDGVQRVVIFKAH